MYVKSKLYRYSDIKEDNRLAILEGTHNTFEMEGNRGEENFKVMVTCDNNYANVGLNLRRYVCVIKNIT